VPEKRLRAVLPGFARLEGVWDGAIARSRLPGGGSWLEQCATRYLPAKVGRDAENGDVVLRSVATMTA